MEYIIRELCRGDENSVLSMMREFYSSAAVFTNGSEEIFAADISACLKRGPYLEGYVFENEGEIFGYAMIAKSFSTEFGKPCIWIEDLYIKDGYRKMGIGRDFLEFITSNYEGAVFRLEVEEENEGAVKLYKSCGFDTLPYMEMKR